MALPSWTTFLLNVMVVLLPTNSENLSDRSAKYIEAFQDIFPHIDMKTQKVYEFVEDEANLKRVMILNTRLCTEEKHKLHRVTRSVYKLMAAPFELMFATTISTTYAYDNEPDKYGYIDPSYYDKFNMTSSELAISKNGWDYSPYFPPGETTTEFVFPSWNYDGKCPEAFWKGWTNHETDLEQSTLNLPDNVRGFTDPESLKLKTFEDVYNAFWDSIYSIPHKCDNYTSIFSCLQGDPVINPNLMDPEDDPAD